jgi:threonine synthase
MRGLSYEALAERVIRPFIGESAAAGHLGALIAEAYAGFSHRAVAPLVQLDGGLWLMELFHGPTAAFKDLALQLLGRLFDCVLAARGRRATIVGATSGDTGSAALMAFADRSRIDVVFLYPEGRISEVQRRQMTTIAAPNVHAVAIDGSFDDCQGLVKAMFADRPFAAELGLSAANSINWARIVAQCVYYVAAAVALGAPDRPVAFTVPTGNFGNVYAAYGARRMGVPVDRLVVATNANDILHRFFTSGTMKKGPVIPTLSPSMDIQVSSNFERLLFDLLGGDAGSLGTAMAAFAAEGAFAVGEGAIARARALFASHRLDDGGTSDAIGATWAATGQVVDPHTAVGLAAARAVRGDPAIPMVALACAHPAKFPDAVEAAIGIRPTLPARLAGLMDRPERMARLPNDLARVQALVRDRVGARVAR